MFTEAAEFVTSSGSRATVACCVFPIEEVDPFADTDLTSDVRRMSILVRHTDLVSVKDKPVVGGLVITPDGLRWKIEKADLEQNWWSLKARSI